MQLSGLDTIAGGGRFRIIRQIGSGGMGVVYEAEDRERRHRIALKALRHRDVEAMYWLKREFRALADIAHPNLVTLYDLVIDDERCFFTMELLEGVSILEFCQPRTEDRDPNDSAPHADTWGRKRALACDEQRLRDCLEQLGRGLQALHDAGKVHCDIKPGNILVTEEGRVVLLDFGLTEDAHHDERALIDGQVFGTVAYMSPEQAGAERELGPASDLYSVGTLLYEALTGQLPFTGSLTEIIFAKQEHAPAPPRALVPSVPDDLDDLCTALLARAPERRPTAADLLRRLGAAAPTEPSLSSRSHSRAIPFTGRDAELRALMDRFYQVASGRAAGAVLRGASGIGKSTLARELLSRLRQRYHGLVVLEGRCYEREHIPYKAMDALVDDLSRYWTQLPRDEAEALLPENAGLLPRLFPVLGRVPAVAAAPRAPAFAHAGEIRARATAALREVLHRLSARGPTVLYLDDMQWVDADTANLLSDVMRAPDSPPLLLLFCSRVEVSEHFEHLSELLDPLTEAIDVAPLARKDAVELARRLIGADAGADADADALASHVAAEAAGSPFFLRELTHHLRSAAGVGVEPVALDRVIAARFAALPDGARRLLEVVAVAGQPIARRVAGAAADLTEDEMLRNARALRALGFVRTAGGRSEDSIEPYHDRVREAVRAHLDDDATRSVHRDLAVAFEKWGEGAPDQLARHWHGAGDSKRAAAHTRAAADAAIATLDFEHAARLYRMTLELDRHPPETERALFAALGEALSSAGRPGEAADAFLEAAAIADPGDRLELRRRSAEELLRGGHLERGVDAIRAVLADIGMGLPRSPRAALVHLVLRRAWLRIRGTRWRHRHRSEIPPRDLARVDACWSVTSGLAIVDPIFGTDYQARHLQLALRSGEPERVARALASEASLLAAYGQHVRAARAAKEARALSRTVGTTYTEAVAVWAEGAVSYFCDNDWETILAASQEAESAFRFHQSAGWEIDTCQLYSCFALMYLGELRELARRVPAHVRAAERRGDRYASTNFRTRLNLVWLIADDIAGAERDLDEAVAAWVPASHAYHLQHMYALFAGGDLDLYRGQPDAAADLITRDRPALLRSQLLRVAILRAEWDHLCGRVALASAAAREPQDRKRAALVKIAGRHARSLERQRLPLAKALAALVRAGIVQLCEGPAEATRALHDALELVEGLRLGLYAVAVRRRLGQCTPGEQGRRLVAEADEWLRDQGVVAPERLVRMLVPGW